MSASLPEVLDARRMVASRREFEGRIALDSMTRLQAFIEAPTGDCSYRLSFGIDPIGVAYLEIQLEAGLPLRCQRTLAAFTLPVALAQRLGLVSEEADEAGLPEGYEPLLLDAEAMIRPAELIEDELILAVPVVPVAPGTEAIELELPPSNGELEAANPFSVLSGLRKQSH